MMREYQVRFRERLGVKSPLPTRQWNGVALTETNENNYERSKRTSQYEQVIF